MRLYGDLHMVVEEGDFAFPVRGGPQSCRSARTRETPAVQGAARPTKLIPPTAWFIAEFDVACEIGMGIDRDGR